MPLTPLSSKIFKVYTLSECAVTLEFGNEINQIVSEKISQFKALIELYPLPGLRSVVSAYTTLSIFYNLPQLIESETLPGLDGYEKVRNYLAELEDKLSIAPMRTSEGITTAIPVCYEPEFAPDLSEVAKHTGISEVEIIRLHTSAIYKVYMIGFTPGFAYLGGMPEVLATPRKQTPAQSVAAGSVGIAGLQTGIYPIMSPGGWQIIGRTPLILFDANRSQPSLLKAGDTVSFVSINGDEFNRLKKKLARS